MPALDHAHHQALGWSPAFVPPDAGGAISTGRLSLTGMRSRIGTCEVIVDLCYTSSVPEAPTSDKEPYMGDKGKKDKAKGQKQKTARNEQVAKEKRDKEPKRKE